MANLSPCLAQMSKLSLSAGRQIAHSLPAPFLAPATKRYASNTKEKKPAGNPQKNKQKGVVEKKKKKGRTTYLQYDQKDSEQFSLCDAMRYIRAFEVGQKPTSVKYDVAVKLKSLKNGPVIRNRLRLPHPVSTDVRICVVCPPDSKYAEDALKAGAVLVGEEAIFDAVKDGRIEFDRCICQTDSLAKMNKAQMGRFLGPRGLMPSTKLGTVVKDPALVMKDLIGGAEYRERLGVIRMAIGQLGFTPEEMQRNIKTFIEALRKDINVLSEKINKEMVEVVLSSTHGPGLPLNGTFIDPNSKITPRELSTGA
ncbi:ribosomal protein L1-like protein [Calycina marina]|uniref:Ribosomal protein L1-like protein n=1 Tax=Calycina marina TaxID=1763456 RepID=A0A9P7Z3N5_9HELO|nr:ribosomal protein L1-like protein [Calycina marina]